MGCYPVSEVLRLSLALRLPCLGQRNCLGLGISRLRTELLACSLELRPTVKLSDVLAYDFLTMTWFERHWVWVG